ncbi:MAG: helix-turn-helix domain-containing protein [Halobacteriota archaeon]
MVDDSKFITKLIEFGLSEKEAQLYLHLLKYGPKPTSLLAKSLKTYREDVYRMLTSLIDKGMVRPSLETPTVYAAVDLDIALETALKKRESELREMEMRKQELQELSKQQRFRPSDEFSTFKILKSVKEIVTVSISSLTSAEKELLFVVPADMLVIASLYGINEESKKLIERGGRVRGISDISYTYIEPAQELLNIGEDIRHYDRYRGLFFGVIDRKICFSSINADISRISLDEPSILLWTDDPIYAEYLASTFEMLWERSIPAAQRIEELLKEGGPPQA